METFLIILGLSILILLIWLLLSERIILKKVLQFKRNENELKVSDEKYYELNYKIKLLTAVTSIILVVGGFLGYNSIFSIKAEINKDIQQYKDKLIMYDSTIRNYENTIKKLEAEGVNAKSTLQNSFAETNRLKFELIKLQKQFTPNIQTYIVKGIPYEAKEDKRTRVYYKNLKTIDGDSLPKFKEPPIITNVLSMNLNGMNIVENTTEYFDFVVISVLQTGGPDIKGNNKFDLIITKYK